MSHVKIGPPALNDGLFSAGVGRGIGFVPELSFPSLFFIFYLFIFWSLLIPRQTLMRLQLPGSANAASIIHPVQLHPLNTHTHTHPPLSLSAIAWLLAVTVIKALHYLFMVDPKYELKPCGKAVVFFSFFPLPPLKAVVSFNNRLIADFKSVATSVPWPSASSQSAPCAHLGCIFEVAANSADHLKCSHDVQCSLKRILQKLNSGPFY